MVQRSVVALCCSRTQLTCLLPRGALLQGAAAQQQLVGRAQQYMIRRTSETLKQ